jgi:hypothetical protein
MLYRVPNGDWFDLRTVLAVNYFEKGSPTLPGVSECPKDLVMLITSTGTRHYEWFEDGESARNWRELIALQVNEACKKGI